MSGTHIQAWDGNPEDHPLRNLQKLSRHLFLREDQDATYLLLNAISDSVICLAQDRRILYANHAARQMLGYQRDALLDSPITSLLPPDQPQTELLDYLYSGELFASDRFVLRHHRGYDLQLLVTAIPVGNPDEVEGAILVLRDISLGLLANLGLDDRERLINGVFESIATGIILQNESGHILRINKLAAQYLELKPSESLGRKLPADAIQIMKENGASLGSSDSIMQQALRARGQVIEKIVYTKNTDEPYLCTVRDFQTNPATGKYGHLVLTTLTRIAEDQDPNPSLKTSLRLQHTMNQILTGLLTEQGPDETMQNALSGLLRLIAGKQALLFCLDESGWYARYRQRSQPTPGPNDKASQLLDKQDIRTATLRELTSMQIMQPIDLGLEKEFDSDSYHLLVAPLELENHIARIAILRPRQEAFLPAEHDRLQAALSIINAALFKASYEKQLTKLAVTDSLTGLGNRRHIFNRLRTEIERSQRYKHPLSVLVLDLDYFKEINDKHGHQAGDQVLREVALVMKQLTRSSDQIGRIGGEEFMVLLPEADLQGALIAAEKLRLGISALRIDYEGSSMQTSISVGCGLHQKDETIPDFYRRLDQLLYHAKKRGRNCVAD